MVYEDFEDGDVDGWTGGISAAGSSPIRGSWSGYQNGTEDASLSVPISQYSNVDWLCRPNFTLAGGENDEVSWNFELTDTSGSARIRVQWLISNNSLGGGFSYVRVYADGSQAFDSGYLSSTGDINQEWDASLSLDWSSGTFSFTITSADGSYTFSDSGLSFSASNAIDRFRTYRARTASSFDGENRVDNIDAPSPPPAPPSLTATVSNGDDIDLAWTDNATNEDGFRVYRARSSGATVSDYTQIADLAADTTAYSDTGLDGGETFYYRVSAYNTVGESLSGEAFATTDLPPPSGVSITVDDDEQMSVTWTDNASDEDNYRVQVSEDGGSWSAVATPGANSTSYTDTVSSSIDTFRYRVRAETTDANSSWAYTATVATNPEGLTITGHDATSIDLSWTGADQADGYEIFRDQASGSTRADYTSIATVGPPTTTYGDTGLENGERYFYRVAATYDGGTDSPLTAEDDQITDLPAPSALSLDTTVEDEIALSWTLNDDSTDGSVEIYRSTDGTLGTEITGGLPADATSYTDTGLADGEQYHYTVRRVTDHAESDSAQQAGVTVLPAPTNLTVDAITDTTVDLSWTDTHDNGQTRVEFKPASTSTWQTFSTLAIGTGSETITGLRNGEQYDARVVATTEHTDTEDT
jgi:hypothetical protein